MSKYNGSESVATMWGRLVSDAARGEVVAIVDKHGNDVAVMISVEMWENMQQRIVELEADGGEIGMWDE